MSNAFPVSRSLTLGLFKNFLLVQRRQLGSYELLPILQNTSVLLPAPTWWFSAPRNSTSRRSDAVLWPPQAPGHM